MDNMSLSHTEWDCTYHIVFIPKYRRKVMYGELRSDIREIIKKLCEYKDVIIVEGSVCVDHIHLCVKIPSLGKREIDTSGLKGTLSTRWDEMKRKSESISRTK